MHVPPMCIQPLYPILPINMAHVLYQHFGQYCDKPYNNINCVNISYNNISCNINCDNSCNNIKCENINCDNINCDNINCNKIKCNYKTELAGKFKICMPVFARKQWKNQSSVWEAFPRYSLIIKIAILGYERI